MAQNILVDVGPARSGKTHRLLDRYRAALRGGSPRRARALWIAPTSRGAAAIRELLLAGDLMVCLAPGVTTFDTLTRDLLAEAQVRLWPVDAGGQRDLLRRIVKQAADSGRLPSFAATARSAGYGDLLVEHIRELKRRGIEPAAFAKAPSQRTEEHRELGQLYSDYQQLLGEHALVDHEGAHWIARDRLSAGNCPLFDNLEVVVVDGFTDFTPTQHDVLRLLAARSEELLISLPGDDGSRPDLFAKTAATLAELRHQHPQLQICLHPPRPSAWAALDYLSAHLFRDPRQVPPPATDVLRSLWQIEFVAAAGEQGEVVEIARRIKQRLADGQARPDEIVVVFRTLHDAAPRVREVFSEYGIPFAMEASPPPLHAPLVRTLLSLLRLAAEDLPFRRVVATVTNNSLTALGGAARPAADWLVRNLQIASGCDKLLDRVEQLANASANATPRSEHFERRAAAARTALPAIRLLADSLGELPEKGTLSQWREALARLAGRLGLAQFMTGELQGETGHLRDQSGGVEASVRTAEFLDRGAWQMVVREFTALERLDARLGEPPRSVNLQEVLRLLVDLASHEALPRSHDEVGRVRVLSAASARTATVKHLFLAGMSEQAFPSPEPAGRLYTEDHYRFFQRVANQNEAGQLSVQVGRPQEEMLLFYEVLTRAEESLTISYPALDEKAQVLPPSPYVTEIERLLGEENLACRRATPQLSPLPPKTLEQSTPLCPTDWRLSAVDRTLEGDRGLLAGVFSNPQTAVLGRSIDAGLRIIHARSRRNEFGPAEGLLKSTAVAERLAGRFGRQHLWSPSQWEKYAGCPYQFFLAEVLGLEPLGDLTLETDYGRRGTLLHEVLTTFHRNGKSQGASAPWKQDKGEFQARLLGVLEETVAATPRVGIDAALAELDRRQIVKWVEKHFDHCLEFTSAAARDGPLTPAHFEFRFGPKRPGDCDEDANSVDKPFELPIDGENIRVTGRIDRIDTCVVGGRTVFSVIDYKSGKTPTLKQDQITSGQRLQLPIYVAAAQALLFNNDATPVAAGYWTAERGFDKRGALSELQSCKDKDMSTGSEKWPAPLEEVSKRVGQFVQGIRQGDFPVFSCDDQCTHRCEFSTVCRVAQVRSLEKVWSPE